jgi:hypothetical protein
MTKKIKCQDLSDGRERLKVKVIKPPLVDTIELKRILMARTKAIIL